MGIYVKSGTFLDHFSDAGFLKSREQWQHLDDSLEEAANIRKQSEIAAVITNLGRITGGSGEIKHLASIDRKLFFYNLGLEPDWVENEKKFLTWLRAHPEWKAA